MLDGRAHALLELAAVEQAGQRVVAREVGQPRRVLALAAHVLHDEHGADGARRAIADRRDAVVDRDRFGAAAQQHDVAFRFDRAAFAQRARDRIGDRRAGRFVDDGEHLRDRALARFGQRPAGEPLGDRIHELDAARRVDGDDRVGDRRERHLRALLLLEQQRFRLPALPDVRQRADEALFARASASCRSRRCAEQSRAMSRLRGRRRSRSRSAGRRAAAARAEGSDGSSRKSVSAIATSTTTMQMNGQIVVNNGCTRTRARCGSASARRAEFREFVDVARVHNVDGT